MVHIILGIDKWHRARIPTPMLPPTLLSFFLDIQPFTNYANDFVNPDYIVSGKFANTTLGAQRSIIAWAEQLSASGPWSVTNKTILAPSGNKNDYMSWAPYYWPDCSKVGNTTELTPEEVWKTCPYVNRDGQFNPDRLTINDIGAFFNVSDSVLYNALAFSFQNESSSIYSQRIANFMDVWFINPDTRMNPNLNYAQMARGPNGQVGQHTGVLDLKGMAKVASGILILRKRNCTDWTDELDSGEYITWLETNKIGTDECASGNNHGSFCFNQLTSLKLLVNDVPGAVANGRKFFDGIYQAQINKTGDQPMEASRTHPYHYRNYNLAAMITNARLLKYADPTSDPWHMTTKAGSNIQNALDMTMTVDPDASGEGYAVDEIFQNVAAVAVEYGDPDGKYVKFLQAKFPEYAWDATFLWDQPLVGDPGPLGSNNGASSGGSNSSGSGSGSVSGPGASGAATTTLGSLPLVMGAAVLTGFFAGW
ncbi:chondroitin AC/alginate lyase [Roridomyces roridus]|uniref:Chondroitin AC/alginate lyase n=1 Tax=Roridomyces roridus TaxID=1738132 RepID=A0AAD7C7L9_9AGAR|nr:chondroitin AC/alginate lyase [Roridomyces roridus]